MEGMSESLFLDPFQFPPQQSPSADEGPGQDGDGTFGERTGRDRPPGSAETIQGTVVESVPASEAADGVLAVHVPLDVLDATDAVLDDAHLWWPRAFKATDSDGHVYFGDGGLNEEGTGGDVHAWATVVNTVAGGLELEWFGRRAALPGATAESGESVRLFLSWVADPEGGATVTVRGPGVGEWLQDWDAVLSGFARFTGGRRVGPGAAA